MSAACFMSGTRGIAEGAHEDGVVVAGEVVESAGRDRDAGRQVVVGAPGKLDELDRKGADSADRLEDLDGFAGHVHTDPVAGDDRDLHAARDVSIRGRKTVNGKEEKIARDPAFRFSFPDSRPRIDP